jgi:hypothetical protein
MRGQGRSGEGIWSGEAPQLRATLRRGYLLSHAQPDNEGAP